MRERERVSVCVRVCVCVCVCVGERVCVSVCVCAVKHFHPCDCNLVRSVHLSGDVLSSMGQYITGRSSMSFQL